MPSCIVPRCGSRKGVRKSSAQVKIEKFFMGITFHRLPHDPGRRELWLQNLKIENYHSKAISHVCSLHFEEFWFIRSSPLSVRLKNEAVPMVHYEYLTLAERLEVLKQDAEKNDCQGALPLEVEINEEDRLEDDNDENFTPDDVDSKKEDVLENTYNEDGTLEDSLSEFGQEQEVSKDSTKDESMEERRDVQPANNENFTKQSDDTIEPHQGLPHDYCKRTKPKTRTCGTSVAPRDFQDDKRKIRYLETVINVMRNEEICKETLHQEIVKNFKRKLAKQQKMIDIYESVIETMRKKNTVKSNRLDAISKIDGLEKEFLDRIIQKYEDASVSKVWSPEFRSFALTLYGHSPKAYEYICRRLDCLLPDGKTIYRWLRSEYDENVEFDDVVFNAKKAFVKRSSVRKD